MSLRSGGEKKIARYVSTRYKSHHSTKATGGSRLRGEARHTGTGLSRTAGRAKAEGLGAGGIVGSPFPSIARSVSAGACLGPSRCLAHRPDRTGKVGHAEQRLAVAEAVRCLLADGVPACVIRKELGLTAPRYYRILDRLNIPHDAGSYHARRRDDARAALDDLGPERPYTFQFTVGYPCNFSVQFEGAHVVITPTPMRYEMQEVEL